MPYTVGNPPTAIKGLPKHLIEIWVAAYNAAFKQYNGNEGKAAGTAWAAVKMKFEKKDDRWVAKEAVHPHGEHSCRCSKCGKEIVVGADIKCNTQTCPKCGGPMVATTAGERREKESIMKESMSDNDKRALLQSAIAESIAVGGIAPQIRDVYDAEVVYEIGAKTFRMSYVIDRKGKVVFGEAEKVVPQTVYTVVQESIEKKVDELTEAASCHEDKYNTSEITDKLLSALEADMLTEADAAPLLTEADALIVKLSEAAAAKTEDGVAFPKSAYAYVPDPEKSSSWKLRLWEDLEKKITRVQLGRAAAALSPGGFRGQKGAIPSAEMSAVKRKIRGEYRKLGVEDEEIPRWVKETETREL